MPSENFDGCALMEGGYSEYLRSKQYQRKLKADRISYGWDKLIESFSGNALNGTLYKTPDDRISYIEPGLRLLAREGRVRRRMLAQSLYDFLKKAARAKECRKVRFLETDQPSDPHYVFLTLREPDNISHDDYRVHRRSLLLDCCRVLKLIRPNAHAIVGLGFEPPRRDRSSEDLIIYDCSQFSDEERQEAERAQQDLDLMTKIDETRIAVKEYPEAKKASAYTKAPSVARNYSGTQRNSPCPCGSGVKYKRCCGK